MLKKIYRHERDRRVLVLLLLLLLLGVTMLRESQVFGACRLVRKVAEVLRFTGLRMHELVGAVRS